MKKEAKDLGKFFLIFIFGILLLGGSVISFMRILVYAYSVDLWSKLDFIEFGIDVLVSLVMIYVIYNLVKSFVEASKFKLRIDKK